MGSRATFKHTAASKQVSLNLSFRDETLSSTTGNGSASSAAGKPAGAVAQGPGLRGPGSDTHGSNENATVTARSSAGDAEMWEGGEPQTMLLGDVRRIQQCVNNLLSNAIKFSPPGSVVDVTISLTWPTAVEAASAPSAAQQVAEADGGSSAGRRVKEGSAKGHSWRLGGSSNASAASLRGAASSAGDLEAGTVSTESAACARPSVSTRAAHLSLALGNAPSPLSSSAPPSVHGASSTASRRASGMSSHRGAILPTPDPAMRTLVVRVRDRGAGLESADLLALREALGAQQEEQGGCGHTPGTAEGAPAQAGEASPPHGASRLQPPPHESAATGASVAVSTLGARGWQPVPATGYDPAFRQYGAGKAQGNKASGIGLLITRQILSLHSGTIRVDSGGLGKGTEITLCLPMRVVPPSASELPDPAAPKSGHLTLAPIAATPPLPSRDLDRVHPLPTQSEQARQGALPASGEVKSPGCAERSLAQMSRPPQVHVLPADGQPAGAQPHAPYSLLHVEDDAFLRFTVPLSVRRDPFRALLAPPARLPCAVQRGTARSPSAHPPACLPARSSGRSRMPTLCCSACRPARLPALRCALARCDQVFNPLGVELEQAANGVEALELVRTRRAEGKTFDAIVVDNQMPRMVRPRAARLTRHACNFVRALSPLGPFPFSPSFSSPLSGWSHRGAANSLGSCAPRASARCL